MYRVVTKLTLRERGQQRVCIDAGPWLPDEQAAKKWAQVFRDTGYYYAVYVESNKRQQEPEMDPL